MVNWIAQKCSAQGGFETSFIYIVNDEINV